MVDRYYGIFVREAELVDETFEQDEQEIFQICAMVKDSNLDFWRDLVHNLKHWQDYRIPKFHESFEHTTLILSTRQQVILFGSSLSLRHTGSTTTQRIDVRTPK
ncbi:hypothetical protein ACFE04_017463 [Oxalis oulophora]